MAKVAWTRRATIDLTEIAEYIAYDNEPAAVRLVERIYDHVEQLVEHSEGGPVPPELPGSDYRQLVEPPCRIFYKVSGETVFIVHVMRSERILRVGRLDEPE